MLKFNKFLNLFFSIFVITSNIFQPSYSTNTKFQCEDDGKTTLNKICTININGLGEKTVDEYIKRINDKQQKGIDKAKGVLGEIAAIYLYKELGYTLLENQASRIIGCTLTTKINAQDNGIDGIFLSDNNITIFNEAKYRKKSCSNGDLKCTSYGQAASIKWYSYHFAHLRDDESTKNPKCKNIDFQELENHFKNGQVLYLMTCLNHEGEISIYESFQHEQGPLKGIGQQLSLIFMNLKLSKYGLEKNLNELKL